MCINCNDRGRTVLISGLELSDMYGGVLYLSFNFHYIITLLLFVIFAVCCKPVQCVDLLLYIYEGFVDGDCTTPCRKRQQDREG